jgi:hypothetical protein
MQKVAACFGSAVRVIQAVVVDHVTGPFLTSARHQRTCNHASKQAARQISFQRRSKECILCVKGWWYRRWSPRACEQWADLHLGQDVRMVLSPFSVICTINLTWLYHLNSWSNLRTYLVIMSGIVQARGAPGIVRRVSSYLCNYLIQGFWGSV